MSTQGIFVNTVLNNKVKLKPQLIASNLKDVLEWTLKHRFEGKCSNHGYIRNNSISVTNFSMGKLIASSLNGDSEFIVEYKADVCNPAIGSVIQATVTTKNNFGILAESYVPELPSQENKNESTEPKLISILEIISVKTHHDCPDIQFDDVKEGDKINVQILGKKFELNDKKISAWGKLVTKSNKTLLEEVTLYENDIDRNDEDVISSDLENTEDDQDFGNEDNDNDDDDENIDGDELNKNSQKENDKEKFNVASLKKRLNQNMSDDEEGEEDDDDDDDDEIVEKGRKKGRGKKTSRSAQRMKDSKALPKSKKINNPNLSDDDLDDDNIEDDADIDADVDDDVVEDDSELGGSDEE